MNKQSIPKSKGTDTGEGTAEVKTYKVVHQGPEVIVGLLENKEENKGDEQLAVEKRRYLLINLYNKKAREERDKRVREEFERRVQCRRRNYKATTKFIKRGRVVKEIKNGVCKRFKQEEKSK